MRSVLPVKYKTQIRFRSDLLTLLSEACEIEHGLACSYLYAAFSLKQGVDENISPSQQQHIRKWASQIFFIASQEMLHLAQVWNLLKSIGGSPYYFRPNFPQPSKYYPFHIPLKLEPFSISALQRFLLYELPSNHKDTMGHEVSEAEYAQKHFGFFSEDNYRYRTVADLYGLIKKGFCTIDEKQLFISDPDWQTTTDEVDFRELIKIDGRDSAKKAINMIMDQGEGTPEDRDDCHFGIFENIRADYLSFLNENPDFRAARDVITNPIVFNKGNYSAGKGELIINEDTRIVADLFDDLYNLMLQALQYSFGNMVGDKSFNKKIAGFAIQMMVRVIKPLGELLTLLPAFPAPDPRRAGPAFSMTRHTTLPDSNELAITIILERASEIVERFKESTVALTEKKETILLHLNDLINQLKT